nr:hypothetical protein GCM10017745_08910 [Saccharothrix mutabilis subsp. capreolus]
MSVVLHWFLPTSGDGRTVVERFHANRAQGGPAPRDAGIDHLEQVAVAAERNGFEGALTPTGTWCEDAWLTRAALIARTRRLKFPVAFRPGVISPTLAAQIEPVDFAGEHYGLLVRRRGPAGVGAARPARGRAGRAGAHAGRLNRARRVEPGQRAARASTAVSGLSANTPSRPVA